MKNYRCSQSENDVFFIPLSEKNFYGVVVFGVQNFVTL